MSAAARAAVPAPELAGSALAAVLFDWDGTLSDTREVLLAAWHRSSEGVLGRRFPAGAAEEDLVFTLPGPRIWPTISRDNEEAERLAAAFTAAYAELSPSVRPFEGVRDALVRLRGAGLAIGVVTSKGRERLLVDAERQRLLPLIDAAVCGGETAAPKPDPSPVLVALERLGVAPARAAMVGDTPVDIAAGAAAGARPIGVAWGHAGVAELQAAGAEAVAETPEELVVLLLDVNQEAVR